MSREKELVDALLPYLDAKVLSSMQAELLTEIDDTLQAAEMWKGNRLDSIKALIRTVQRSEKGEPKIRDSEAS